MLGSGEKIVIMSLWDVFCQDEAGNVTVLKPQVLFPEDAQMTEYTPETNEEGSWNLGRDEDACWIITSGIPGLCPGPDKLTGYEIPATESGVPN